MYCRNCGALMQPGMYACTKCGVPAGAGNLYCPNCGAHTDPNAVMCVTCSVGFCPPPNFAPPGVEQKSKVVAALLAFLLGSLGIHNFYLGYTGKAVTQLLLTLVASALTCGLSALAAQIWAIVEGVQILTGTINTDSAGCPLKKDI
jgi:TM2 domain-containing membrane protein YozV